MGGFRARGIPAGFLNKAERYTVKGSASDVNDYVYNDVLNQGQAIAATEIALNRYAQDGSKNPYHQLLSTNMYDVPNLGDAQDQGDWFFSGGASYKPMTAQGQPSAGPPTATSGGLDWMNVLNTVAGNITKGIAAKIGGHAPAPVTVIQPGGGGFPTWGYAAVGGGALALILLLRRS